MEKVILYRASSMGNLMTEGRGKNDILGETSKKELAKVYAYNKYGITEPIDSVYFKKGIIREEMGITYLSRLTKKMYSKNETRIVRAEKQLTGLPDLFEGKDINSTEVIIDIKNAYSYTSFLKQKTEQVQKDRHWQAQTYMALTGAMQCDFAVCCINAPMEMIMDAKRKLAFTIDEDSPEFLPKVLEIERNMIFDLKEFKKEYPFAEIEWERQKLDNTFVNIPWEKRIFIKSVPRSEMDILAMDIRRSHWNKYIEETFES